MKGKIRDHIDRQELTDMLISKGSTTSVSNEIKYFLWNYTDKLPADSVFKERKYCFLNGIEIPPKCALSDNFCYFIFHKGEYSKYSKEYYDLIKFDLTTKAMWLSWENLFLAGLPLEEAMVRRDSKYYLKVRLGLLFETFDRESFLNELINDGFEEQYARNILDECNVNDYRSIDVFIDKYSRAKNEKNNSLDHYIFRGHKYSDAVLLIQKFFRAGTDVIRTKRAADPAYDEKFRLSRKNGLMANKRSSKREIEISHELSARGFNVDTSMVTNVDKYSEFRQSTDRNYFCHDIFIPDKKLIIEYNGIFWHKNTDFEIKKAYYCSELNACRYMLIWEDSFDTTGDAVQFILKNIDNENRFMSSKISDEVLYERLRYGMTKQRIWDKKFLEVANTLSEMSHCQSKKVCALAVKNNRIIATGLNGSINGVENCCDKFPQGINDKNRDDHRAWSKLYEVHAEVNLIAEAAKSSGINLDGSTIYVNLQPCQSCSLLLTSIGAKRIVYGKSHDKGHTDYSYWLFKNSNILFHHEE